MAWQTILDLGDEVVITGKFANEETGVPVDPATVKLELRKPNATKALITGSDISKQAVGTYVYATMADVAGEWRYRWIGEGTGQGSSDVLTFNVRDVHV